MPGGTRRPVRSLFVAALSVGATVLVMAIVAGAEARVAAVRAPGPTGWEGTWETTLGPMELRQADYCLVGTFGVDGRIWGRLHMAADASQHPNPAERTGPPPIYLSGFFWKGGPSEPPSWVREKGGCGASEKSLQLLLGEEGQKLLDARPFIFWPNRALAKPGSLGSFTGFWTDWAGRMTRPRAEWKTWDGQRASRLDYTMPARFGLDKNNDRLVDYVTTAAAADPGRWRVEFTVSGCNPNLRKFWRVDGKEVTVNSEGGCRYSYEFKSEGRHRVRVTDSSDLDVESEVVVQDWLIAGLGDSNGSGEGNPDLPAPAGVGGVTWEDLRCDRSSTSFQATAARMVEERDVKPGDAAKTSVTFVHLACSGASIPNGMIGFYEGINDPGGAKLPSQLATLKTLVGKREIDAVIVSIGVNDLGFGSIVKFCLDNTLCQTKPFPDATSAQTLDDVVKARLAELSKAGGRYDALADYFTRLGIPPERIYISQYFDSTRDKNGQFCDPLIQTADGGSIFARAEAQWAFESVLSPLNDAVAAAATKHRWKLISGVADAFRTHGYCSTDPWIVGLRESLFNQHDANGTLHASATGHQAVAEIAYELLRNDLYPGGKTRPPQPASTSESDTTAPAAAKRAVVGKRYTLAVSGQGRVNPSKTRFTDGRGTTYVARSARLKLSGAFTYGSGGRGRSVTGTAALTFDLERERGPGLSRASFTLTYRLVAVEDTSSGGTNTFFAIDLRLVKPNYSFCRSVRIAVIGNVNLGTVKGCGLFANLSFSSISIR